VAHRKSIGKIAGAIPPGTRRNADGYLEPNSEGAWWMPDGSFITGTPDKAPDEGALWRSYYDATKRTLEIYVQNKRGLELTAYQLSLEGWPFRSRDGEPRPINKDDVRRIVRNWPEYGGLVLDKASKKRHVREFKLDELRFNPERAVFPIELLYKVAKVQYERSGAPFNHGVNRDVRVYVLNGMTYCAYCERRAEQQKNPKLRSRLSGDKLRYRHKSGVLCGCTNKSVPADKGL
jgi:hypothetical protein